jgi:hypothetical protein
VPPNWSVDAALPILKADAGNQTTFNCLINANSRLEGPAGNTAVNIPQLGIRKITPDTVELKASSVEAATKILTTAFVGASHTGDMGQVVPSNETLLVRGCRPVVPPTGARMADQPLDHYELLSDSFQVMEDFYAMTGAPVPYETLTRDLYPAFTTEPDAFKKHDLLQQATAEIAAAVKQAKPPFYVHLRIGGAPLPPYDFGKGAYALKGLVDANSGATLQHSVRSNPGDVAMPLNGRQSTADVQFLAAPRFFAYKPASEAEARNIEQHVAVNEHRVDFDVYGKVIAAYPVDGVRTLLVELTQLDIRPTGAAATSPPVIHIVQ